MFLQLYHTEILTLNQRREFELPSWPYKKNCPECLTVFRDYMKSLSVFYYCDSEAEAYDPIKKEKFKIDYPIHIEHSGDTPLELPFEAYYSECHITSDSLKIMSYPQDDTSPESIRMLENMKNCPVRKDMLAWRKFCIPGTVKSIADRWIEFKPNTDEISQIMGHFERIEPKTGVRKV